MMGNYYDKKKDSLEIFTTSDSRILTLLFESNFHYQVFQSDASVDIDNLFMSN